MENMGISPTALELIFRVLCDERPVGTVQGAYLYCQTKDNQPALFQTAFCLLNQGAAIKILVLQTEGQCGYPGFARWNDQLLATGLTENQIEGIALDELPLLHTLVESEALVHSAAQKGYTSLLLVAPPFQQLRGFMTAVTVALREYPQLSLYSYPAETMPWQEEVVHSQGIVRATRSELIHEELARIDTYQKKGDLVSFGEVLAYMNNRRIL